MTSLEEFLSSLRQQEITIWLDGDRLRYRAPEGKLLPKNLVELRDRKAEIIAFLQAAKQLASNHQLPLQPVPREGHLPLSFAQQRFWFLYQFEPDSPANNVPVVVRFTGSLNLDVLKRSVSEVTRRHEVLRSRFPNVDGQPTLVIDPEFEVKLPIVDLRQIPSEQRDAETHRAATKDARQPFDLEKGPLLRLTLFRVNDQEHLLLWNIPCIICDGTSSDLFYRELTACYSAYVAGTPLNLPDLPIQYMDFAHWQRQYLQGEVLECHLKYWQQQLSEDLTSLKLPTDYLRPSGLRTCRGDRYARMLPKSLHQELITLSQQLGTTLFVVLLATFDVLLHRYSQQDDILTTFVSSGRNRVETENLIGFFSNTLILRTHFDSELTFRELVQRIHSKNLDAYTHQELPFERLVDALRPEQRQGRSPLFQTKFTLNSPWTNRQGMAPVILPDLKIESLFGYIYHGETKYDLILVTREQDQGLGAVIDYNAELFTESTMERMMGHFQTLLKSVVVNPDQAIATLPLLTLEEQHLLADWSRTEKDLSAILAESGWLHQFQSSNGVIEQLIENVQSCVLDRHLQPVPPGVSGDLYIGRADWGQDDAKLSNLTELQWICDRFTNDPTIGFLNTGVIVRYKPNGDLELAEGASKLAIPELTISDLSIPTSASRDVFEYDLTHIWEQLLGVHPIRVHDNFFDLGGQSLLAVQLFAQIEKVFGKRLPLSTLLKTPTIKQMAEVLRREDEAEAWLPLVTIQSGNGKIPLFCIHGGGFNILIYRDLALNLGSEYPVYGLQARGLEGDTQRVSTRLEEIAADYIQQIRQVQPEGPYLLSGLSNGGNIAFEMAQQLHSQGNTVGLLALFDTYQPNSVTILPPFPRLLSSLKYLLLHSLPRFIAQSRQKHPGDILSNLQKKLHGKQSSTPKMEENLSSDSEKAAELSPDAFLRAGQIKDSHLPKATQANQIDLWMDKISQYVLEHSPWSFFLADLLKEIEGSLSETLMKLEQTYGKAQKNYVPKPYSGEVVLFRADEAPPGFQLDPYLGWKKLILGGLKVHRIPGHHTSIIRSPILAKKLSTYIDEVQQMGTDSTEQKVERLT